MRQRRIEVVDYDPGWASLFESEKALLKGVLGRIALEISHIGSTSVVGLAAKPIIDIQIEVSSLSALDGEAREMEALGYEIKGENGIQGRRYFRKGGVYRTHHVHAFETGDGNLVRHLALRDYLTENPRVAKDYARLKKTLASVFRNDSQGYQTGKDDFLGKYEGLALDWHKGR